eukprot:668490-Rhodomonas_salina.3
MSYSGPSRPHGSRHKHGAECGTAPAYDDAEGLLSRRAFIRGQHGVNHCAPQRHCSKSVYRFIGGPKTRGFLSMRATKQITDTEASADNRWA